MTDIQKGFLYVSIASIIFGFIVSWLPGFFAGIIGLWSGICLTAVIQVRTEIVMVEEYYKKFLQIKKEEQFKGPLH